MMIKIGPELYSEMEYKLETMQDEIDIDSGVYKESDLFELRPTEVELTQDSYDRVLNTDLSINSYGVSGYRKLWTEIKEFYIECKTAIPFDREAY